MQLGVPNETIPTCSEAPFLIIVSGPPKLILIKLYILLSITTFFLNNYLNRHCILIFPLEQGDHYMFMKNFTKLY